MREDNEQIIEATSAAVRRQEHRNRNTIIAGCTAAVLILLIFGLIAVARIETLIGENRQATLENRAQAHDIEARQNEIQRDLTRLIVAQEAATQRIIIVGDRREASSLRELERELAGVERRLTRMLNRQGGDASTAPGGR